MGINPRISVPVTGDPSESRWPLMMMSSRHASAMRRHSISIPSKCIFKHQPSRLQRTTPLCLTHIARIAHLSPLENKRQWLLPAHFGVPQCCANAANSISVWFSPWTPLPVRILRYFFVAALTFVVARMWGGKPSKTWIWSGSSSSGICCCFVRCLRQFLDECVVGWLCWRPFDRRAPTATKSTTSINFSWMQKQTTDGRWKKCIGMGNSIRTRHTHSEL